MGQNSQTGLPEVIEKMVEIVGIELLRSAASM
jgi:hypothetical protein